MPISTNIPTDFDSRVLSVIRQYRGMDQDVTSAAIARRLMVSEDVHGYDCQRVRRSVRRLRHGGHFIASTNRGYRLADSPEDIKAGINYLVHKIRGQVAELRACVPEAGRRIEELLGQIPLFQEEDRNAG